MTPVTIPAAAMAVFLRSRNTSLPGVVGLLGRDPAKIGETLDADIIGRIARSMGLTEEKLVAMVKAFPPANALMPATPVVASVKPVYVPAPAPASTHTPAPAPLPVVTIPVVSTVQASESSIVTALDASAFSTPAASSVSTVETHQFPTAPELGHDEVEIEVEVEAPEVEAPVVEAKPDTAQATRNKNKGGSKPPKRKP